MPTQPRYASEEANTATGSLSPEQVASYREEGYLVLRSFLTDEDMAPVRRAMNDKVSEIAERLFAAGKISDQLEDEPFETRLARLFEGKSDEDFLEFGRSWRDRHSGYFEFMSNPKILDAVESLIGDEIFSNPVYNTRPKVPKVAAGAVPWHQDRSYWPGANANPVITVWIPLVDSNEINGCSSLAPDAQHEPHTAPPRDDHRHGLHRGRRRGRCAGAIQEDLARPDSPGGRRRDPLQRPMHPHVHAEPIESRSVERRSALPADQSGPHAATRSRLPLP